MVPCSATDIGPDSKAAPYTQILTTSFVASLREKLLRKKLTSEVGAGTGHAAQTSMYDRTGWKGQGLLQMQQLQRQTRSKLAEEFLQQQRLETSV
jgi:hypothetical protein